MFKLGRLTDRIALVTGAARGIGAATAIRFAKEGASVVLLDLEMEEKNTTAEKIEAFGRETLPISVDVSHSDQVNQAVKQAVNHFGKIDILVNNAGILNDNTIESLKDDQWDQVMDINLKGTFLCSRAVQKYMVENRYGKIVNISSMAARGTKGRVNYASAKAGIQGLTRALAMELGPKGINVNSVSPGFIETDMTKASSKAAEKRGINYDENKAKFIENNCIQRVGTVSDVANAILFFASDESNYITGQNIYVSGRP